MGFLSFLSGVFSAPTDSSSASSYTPQIINDKNESEVTKESRESEVKTPETSDSATEGDLTPPTSDTNFPVEEAGLLEAPTHEQIEADKKEKSDEVEEHHQVSPDKVLNETSGDDHELYDVIIIGGGPAGISASIYAVRKSLKVLLVTKDIGGQAALSGDIENVIGYSLVTGAELAAKFRDEVEKFKDDGITIKEGEEVVNLIGMDPNFMVKTASGGEYHGKTVIIASGRTPRLLGVPGEKEFLGKGVATCATCDGPLYKGKDVAVIGGGNSALDAAFSLLKVVNSLTIINSTDDVKGDSVLLKNVTSSPKVKILNKHQVLEIKGDQFVTGIKVEDMDTKESKDLSVAGVFIEIGWIPSTAFDNLTHKNDHGEIMVDEFGQTLVDGLFAAGDVNDLWGEQIIIAAGEGAKVALRVAEHLSKAPHSASSNIHEGA